MKDLTDSMNQTEKLLKRMRIEGTSRFGGFSFIIDPSVPYIATAIHSGHNVREELRTRMSLSDKGRLFEEDYATDRMIRRCQSAVWGLDSRAEYDLNRSPELALPLTPERFWGVEVFREEPPEEMNRLSLEKYFEFHSFLETCVRALLQIHGACIVYDIHSYNISRQEKNGVTEPPLFNLGTALLDRKRWASQIDDWLDKLAEIALPGISTTVAENKVFSGKGELCRRLTALDSNVLVLPTEISKIYMDEHSGREYPNIIDALSIGLHQKITEHSERFF